MKKIETALPGVYILEPDVHGDRRGYFMETYNRQTLADLGITGEFVQDNQSFTAARGVLRGIHFQNAPHAQAKLVRVTRGAVMDVAVDLRRGSPTYRRWTAVELSAENRRQILIPKGFGRAFLALEDNTRMLYIPRGFGHGFKTLTDDVEFCYKVDSLYNRDSDRGIRFDDPAIGVQWGEVTRSLLSPKDMAAPLLEDSDCNFVYGEI